MIGWLLALSLQTATSEAVPAPVIDPSVEATRVPDVEVTLGPEGVVVLECGVLRSGAVRDCVVISETPAGQGFGSAALSAARRARLPARSIPPNGGKVRFTTRFRLQS